MALAWRENAFAFSVLLGMCSVLASKHVQSCVLLRCASFWRLRSMAHRHDRMRLVPSVWRLVLNASSCHVLQANYSRSVLPVFFSVGLGPFRRGMKDALPVKLLQYRISWLCYWVSQVHAIWSFNDHMGQSKDKVSSGPWLDSTLRFSFAQKITIWALNIVWSPASVHVVFCLLGVFRITAIKRFGFENTANYLWVRSIRLNPPTIRWVILAFLWTC